MWIEIMHKKQEAIRSISNMTELEAAASPSWILTDIVDQL